MHKLNQNGVISHILIMIILLIGLAIAFYLVKNQTIFNSRANQAVILDALEITDAQGNPLNCDASTNPPTCNITSPNVVFKVKNIDALTDNSLSLVKSVLAQETESSECSYQVNGPLYTGQQYPVTITMKNVGSSTWSAAKGYVLASRDPDDNSVWGLNRVPLSNDIPPGNSAVFSFNITTPSTPGDYDFSWQMINDTQKHAFGSKCSPRFTVSTSPEQATPTSNPTIEPTPGIEAIPEATPAETSPANTPKVYGITINGQLIEPINGSTLDMVIPIDDLTKEADIPIPVRVGYANGDVQVYILNFYYIPQGNIEDGQEFFVDFVIFKTSDPKYQTEWDNAMIQGAKKRIDDTNMAFQKAGIKHRVKLGEIISNYDVSQGCPFGGTWMKGNENVSNRKPSLHCAFNDYSRIRVWVNEPNGGATADPDRSFIRVPLLAFIGDDPEMYVDNKIKKSFLHEMGHVFNVPHYYIERIPPHKNKVVPIGIEPYVNDVMDADTNGYSFTSKSFANEVKTLPAVSEITNIYFYTKYTPKETILKIIDYNNSPIVGAKVDVFSATPELNAVGTARELVIPNKISFSGNTNSNGEFILGNAEKIFPIDESLAGVYSALIRITYEDEVRYFPITMSYLYTRYFEGHKDINVITKQFSELIKYDPKANYRLQGEEDSLEFDSHK